MEQLGSELHLRLEVTGNRSLVAVLGPIPRHLALLDALALLEQQLRQRRQQLARPVPDDSRPVLGVISHERRSLRDRRLVPDRRRTTGDAIRRLARLAD
jgi:hypothetical protein